MSDYSQKFKELVQQHRTNPDYTGTVNVLGRSMIDYDQLPTAALRELGFIPSYVAVPEAGQSSLRTYRHPDNNMHFHKHTDKWVYHEDSWPSISMVAENMRQKGIENPYKEILFNNPSKLGQGALHGVVEGVPGYFNYLAGRITGRPTFPELISNNIPNRTMFDRTGRVALASLAASAPAFALGKPELGGAIAGGVTGFTAAQSLGNYLGAKYNSNYKPGSWQWSVLRAGFGGLLPILGTVAGSVKGRNLIKRLISSKMDKDKKKEESNELN